MASILFLNKAKKLREARAAKRHSLAEHEEPRMLDTSHVPSGHMAVPANMPSGTTHNTKLLLIPHYKDVPVHTTCVHCKREITTRVRGAYVDEAGCLFAACCCAGLFTFGILWCWCAHSLYVKKSMTVYKHSCPKCKKHLGTFKWD